ncbi:YafY family protein [Bacteroides sp. 224]|uniref:helix-turn-helix transcriptional regulator n=1 Tax=Bacteroides sp. 224 TaxID=2302936 RepID=UPI0013D3C525|nr:WYL domain-containing protein [Bacteroides sp. 224]NDV66877.1 WYL domain-containing protein [Bacteroides sp. 224]
MSKTSKKIGFLQRWMFIIDKIYAHPYISMQELEYAVKNEMLYYDGIEDIGISVRTIERDLAEIRNSPYMDISIEFCRKQRGYYIPKNEKSLSKLNRLFELSSLFSFSDLKDIVYLENRKSKGLEHRFRLITAIQNSVEIIIEYSKYQTQADNKLRYLQPYGLREFKNRWYLLAIEVNEKNENEKSIKTWGLDRIKVLTITNRKFKKDKTIRLKDQFEHCFGIYADKKMKAETIILSFTPLRGKYIDSCPLHESQQVLINNEEEFRIALTVKLTPDLITELFTYSGEMKVIKPQSLNEKLIEMHRNAIRNLTNKPDSDPDRIF